MSKILKLSSVNEPTSVEPHTYYSADLVYFLLPDGGAYVWKNKKGNYGTYGPEEFTKLLASHQPELGSREHMLETLHNVYRYFQDTAAGKLIAPRSYRRLDETAQKELGRTVAQYWDIKE